MDARQIWDDVRQWMTSAELLGMEVWRIFAAIGVFLLIYLLRRVIVRFLVTWGQKLAAKTETEWDDLILSVIKPPLAAALQVGNVWGATAILRLPQEPWNIRGTVNGFLLGAIIIIAAWAAIRSTSLVTAALRRLTSRTESALDDRLVPFLERFLRIVVVLLAILMLLQEAGFKISGILAGLGLGGLAIALAAKDMLSNIFASITILGDDPFTIGEWIKTKDVEGIVEDIGFRSTKVRTFANSLVTIPNSALVSGGLENFSRMEKRRISFHITVTYETTTAMLRESTARVREILGKHSGVRQDFWIVNFTDFGDSSLNIMVYCFTKTTVWAEFLEVREELNMQIMEALEEIGVEFAFPSRSLYMVEPNDEERQKLHERSVALLQARAKKSESHETTGKIKRGAAPADPSDTTQDDSGQGETDAQ